MIDYEGMKLDHYDPPEDRRVWMRHHRDGAHGWLCRRDGQTYVRLHRPHEVILRPWREGEWLEEKPPSVLHRGQLVQIAYEADRAYRRFVGTRGRDLDWNSLHDNERIEFSETGPLHDEYRARLYRAVMEALGDLL